jgi:AsmA protein
MRLRTILIILAVIVLLPVGGIAVFLATFDANAYKPQIIEAARNATGRELRLSGPIRVKPALLPTLAVEDVGFANMQGGSRPEMARLARLEVRVALLPLLRRAVEIASLTLIEPDILLERLADGRANWQIGPAAAAAPPPAAAPAPAPVAEAPAARPRIGIDRLRIERGRLTLADALTGQAHTIELPLLDAELPAGSDPMAIDARAVVNGQQLTLKLAAGPLARLLLPPGENVSPWPIDLALAAADARLAVKGTLTRPAEGKGFDLAITAEVPEVARLAAFAPDLPLPPLRGVRLAVQAADRGAALPEVRALNLAVGDSDLAAFHPGLRLSRLQVTADSLEAPLTLAMQAALAGVTLAAEGRTGPLAALLPEAAGTAPWPVALQASAGAARAAVEGSVARPAAWEGLDLALRATVPDLAALSPLAGQQLPAVKDVAFAARLTDRDRGSGFALRDIAASAMGSDINGEASLLRAQRSRIEATLTSRRIDADALMATLPAAPAPAAAAPAAPTPPRDGRMIPDTPLPLEPLKLIDARLALTIGELLFGATPYRDVAAQVALANGHLQVTGLKATLPSGALSGGLDLDAGKSPPPVALALRAPALELATLLPPLGVPFPVRGALELDLDVKGSGASPRAIAATLNGHLGIAVGQGTIDNRLIDLLAGDMWRALVPGAPRTGNTNVNCIATRLDLAGGVATARALLFDTSLARVSGSGTMNLGQERLALRMLPTLRVAGGGISVPVNVTGTFAAPSYRPDAAGALGGIAAGAASGAGQGATVGGPLGAIVGGIVGATRQGAGDAAAEDCPAALALARGRAAPAAAPQPQPQQAPAPATRSPIPGVPLPRLPFR